MEFLKLEEVLSFIDKEFGYGQDPYSKEVLNKLSTDDKQSHVLDRNQFHQIKNSYVKKKLGKSYDDNVTLKDIDKVIELERYSENLTKYDKDFEKRGEIKKGKLTAYNKEDIISFIEDEKTNKKIRKQFETKTIEEFNNVPSIVYKHWIKETEELDKQKNKQSEPISIEESIELFQKEKNKDQEKIKNEIKEIYKKSLEETMPAINSLDENMPVKLYPTEELKLIVKRREQFKEFTKKMNNIKSTRN